MLGDVQVQAIATCHPAKLTVLSWVAPQGAERVM